MQKKAKNRLGFTLVELLAVLMIISMMVGIGIPAMINLQGGSQCEAAARTVKAAFNLAKMTAVAHNSKAMVEFQRVQAVIGQTADETDYSASARSASVPALKIRVLEYKNVTPLIKNGTNVKQLVMRNRQEIGTAVDYSQSGYHFALNFREPLIESTTQNYVKIIHASSVAAPGLGITYPTDTGIYLGALDPSVDHSTDATGNYIYPATDRPQLYYDNLNDEIYYRVWSAKDEVATATAGSDVYRKLERDWKCWVDFFPDGTWRCMKTYDSSTPSASVWNGDPVDAYVDVPVKILVGYVPPSNLATECEYYMITLSPGSVEIGVERVSQY